MTTVAHKPDTTPAVDEHAIKLATRQADSLRHLADLIQANPALADDMSHPLRYGLSAPLVGDEQRATMAAFARAATRAGAKVEKQATDRSKYFDLVITLGEVTLRVYSDREQVCERVVTGTREVVEEVPDPEALAAAVAEVPTTKVTRTEEIVEWVCGPLLAPAAGGAA